MAGPTPVWPTVSASMAIPTVNTIADEAPWTNLPTKSNDFDWPKEKASVDAAKAIRPQRYGPCRDSPRSANHPAIALQRR